jgi:hypothetical protein
MRPNGRAFPLIFGRQASILADRRRYRTELFWMRVMESPLPNEVSKPHFYTFIRKRMSLRSELCANP